MSLQVAFVDSRVADWELLVSGLNPGIEVILLAPERDGVQQMAEALAGRSDIDAIHILSHGSEGALYLGGTVLSSENLDDHAFELTTIGDSLADSADILLYGCNVAQGDTGERFIAALSEYTGADVAASTDLTGSGGDWELESSSGSIEAHVAVDVSGQQGYQHALVDAYLTNGDDHYVATSGDDSVHGYDGDDTILGGGGHDFLVGGGGNDSLVGEDGDDFLVAGDGIDTLIGGAGNDTLRGASGVGIDDSVISTDTMVGGPGDERYHVDHIDDVVVELENEGTNDRIYTHVSYTLPDNVERGVYESSESITLTGNDLDNRFTFTFAQVGCAALGLAGNDTFEGSSGDDTFDGGEGTDLAVFSGLYADYVIDQTSTQVTVSGLNSTDVLRNIESIEFSDGTVDLGPNIIVGSADADDLIGTDGRDLISGLGGNDALDGAGGNDTLNGGRGSDSMTGGAGNDVYYVDIHTDLVIEVAIAPSGLLAPIAATSIDGFIDTVLAGINLTLQRLDLLNVENLILASQAEDTSNGVLPTEGTGNALDNEMTGNDEGNQLSGADGDDTLRGGAGNDSLNGGAGFDWAYYDSAAEAVKVTLVTGAVQNTLGAGSDSLAGIEGVLGTASADNLAGNSAANALTGEADADTLRGASGTDTLLGGDGDDIVRGDGGDDSLDGGVGTDWAYYNGAAGAVTVSLATAGAQNTVGSGVDTLANIENALGTSYGDTLVGDGNANYLRGEVGNDTLNGGAGNDTLLGGDSNDTLRGEAGNDSLHGGAGFDWAYYDTAGAAIKITLVTGAVQNTLGAGSDSLAAIEGVLGTAYADNLAGNSAANALRGELGNDTLLGASGNDTLLGGDGDDIVRGDGGDDSFDGGAGTDWAYYNGAAGAVTVSLAVAGAQNTVGSGIDVITNVENVLGTSYGDTLVGNGGANYLRGEVGNDTLSGGAGNDTFLGGAGADRFEYSSALNASTNLDRIVDFSVVDDLIALDNDVFTAFMTENVALAAAAFRSGAGVTTAGDADDRIAYNTNTGALYYDADGVGGAASIQFAVLNGAPALTAGDFLIVG